MANAAYADFFASQDQARRQTGRLVALFTLGVAATMLSLWVVAATVLAFALGSTHSRRDPEPQWAEAFTSLPLFAGVVVVVGAIVGIATLVKLAQLSQGGSKIAEMLGGTPIDPNSRLPGHRQILDIVEEMSIASGVPVPPVYLIESDSINAFAAGPDPSNSVIGVTGGLLRHLTRDELQGVIAHEYSHIFHGDTRINARTTAVIAGIMALGVIGYVLFRFVGPAIARSGSGKNKGGAAGFGVAVIVVGGLVWAIGSLGMLFGRLIQAAISRQREYLADAAAVQYTRNPDGIGGALAKIRDHYGARIASPAAQELNHFLFCSSISSLFATHPPIDERIARIVAMGANSIGAAEARRAATPASSPARASRAAGPTAAHAAIAGLAGTESIAGAGSLDPDAIRAAQDFTHGLPNELRAALHDGDGVRAVCYAIARRRSGSGEADRTVATRDPAAAPHYSRVAATIWNMRGDRQIALVDLAAPALAALGLDGYRAFRETLRLVVQSDGRTDLREWTLLKSLERRVESRLAKAQTRAESKANARLGSLAGEVRVVLTIAACASHGDGAPAQEAVRRAGQFLGDESMTPAGGESRTLDALDLALKRLSTARYAERERMLAALSIAVSHDGRVSVDEHLIVRAAADALDVPLPALDVNAR